MSRDPWLPPSRINWAGMFWWTFLVSAFLIPSFWAVLEVFGLR